MDRVEAWKAEETRQAQILANAINAAIMETSKQFEAPLLNALAGAIVSIEAEVICTAPAGKPRKALREMMERGLRKRIVEKSLSNQNRECVVMTVGGPQQ